MGRPPIEEQVEEREAGREKALRALLAAESWPTAAQAGLPEAAPELARRGGFIGCRIQCHGTLPRAMDEARALVARLEARGRDPYSGTIILARELTNGRGRMGRTWFGPPGGVYLALLVAPETMPERIGLYPLAAGLAACAAVREHLPEARLKWVNDVLSSGRKVCGLLAESFHSARHRQEYLLLGVGLNANISGFPPELDGLATSLCLELGRQVDLDRLTVRLITWLRFYIGLLHHHDQRLLEAGLAEGLAGGDAPTDPLLAAFRLVSDTFGRGVLYRGGDGDPGVRARAIDLADDGGLILEHEGGGRHTAHGGEILYLD